MKFLLAWFMINRLMDIRRDIASGDAEIAGKMNVGKTRVDSLPHRQRKI